MLSAGIILIAFPSLSFGVAAEELDQKIKDQETSFYRELFDKIVYDQFASLLRFDRIKDRLLFKKYEALDVNPFDEVPDSGFFVNRHARKHLSSEELREGPDRSEGPDLSGSLRVMKGKSDGMTAGFFVEDQKGARYLLKFDPKDNPEMATSAETIAHKLFYAFGYHVAQYYLIDFNPTLLTPDPKATYYNEDGFKKPLTQEALQELIEKIPKRKGGLVRASASKLIENDKGYMDFEGRRKSDPDDLIPHEDRRSLRALRVFGSWLNHYDLREGNTLDAIETEDGKPVVKHYLIDFGSALGSAANHPKVPAAGYEHIVDWYEIGKAAPTLKIVEKPWERKWDELHHRGIANPALGYFDNAEFQPEAWKTQLPYEVFRRLTRADAFWAAKILMSFSNEEIKAVVDTARFSDSDSAHILSEILIVRRDIIARYWFGHVTPLDRIRLFQVDDGTYQIRFEDLSLKYGFAPQEGTRYRYQLMSVGSGGSHRLSKYQDFEASPFSFKVPSLKPGSRLALLVQAKYGQKDDWSDPPLKIILAQKAEGATLEIVQIDHGV